MIKSQVTVGIDEVGRGCWAGPVCVAAVAWGANERLTGLNDSKQLTAKRRLKMINQIREKALSVGIGWVSAAEIDQIGISAALKLAASKALQQISVEYDQIIIDGNIMLVTHELAITQIKADATVPSVMAASVIAKVLRDNFMEQMDSIYSEYGFGKHVGYGTAVHRQVLDQKGVCGIHRMSFSPMKSMKS